MDTEPILTRTLFRMGLASVSKANVEDRQALFEFSLRHERVLLQYVLKALSEEERISVRYFLVDLLSHFSAAATPVYISKARNSPWQLTRNLVVVLAQQGYPQAVPALKTLSKHPHPNVRKEALKALKTIERRSGEIEDHAS
jgi:HEAT repeat protein